MDRKTIETGSFSGRFVQEAAVDPQSIYNFEAETSGNRNPVAIDEFAVTT